MSKGTLLNALYTAEERTEAPEQALAASSPQASYFLDLLRIAYGTQSDGPGTAVVFTGLDRGCGVSYVCCSVAAELALRGGKVLLADAEAIAALAGVPRPGAYCERIEPGRVWVLGMNQVNAERPHLATGRGSSTSVLRLLQPEFSFVVIDAPTVPASDVALSLAGMAQGVVFVAQAGKTVARELKETQNHFKSLGARVLGTVYNAR